MQMPLMNANSAAESTLPLYLPENFNILTKKFNHTAPPVVPTTFHAALSSEICQSRL